MVPEIIVECSRGKFPELEKLKADLNSEVSFDGQQKCLN